MARLTSWEPCNVCYFVLCETVSARAIWNWKQCYYVLSLFLKVATAYAVECTVADCSMKLDQLSSCCLVCGTSRSPRTAACRAAFVAIVGCAYTHQPVRRFIFAAWVLCCRKMSICLSIPHTLVLCRNIFHHSTLCAKKWDSRNLEYLVQL